MRCDAVPYFTMIKDWSHDTHSRSVLTLLLCAVHGVVGCTTLTGTGEAPLHCPSSVQAKVSAAQPTVHVFYTEPSITVEGDSLTNLAKTSIYYDLGRGRILAKEVPATRSSGGGEISETVTIPIKSKDEQTVTICVTASDRNGNESTMTP
jgi:hypothetical protein